MIPVMQMPKIEDDIVLFQGGLDRTTPNLKLKPGHVRSAENWQAVANEEGGGYERVGGYERFTGQSSPSTVTYTILVLNSWILKPSLLANTEGDLVGIQLVGSTSGLHALFSVSPLDPPTCPRIGGGAFRQRRLFSVEDANDSLWDGQPYVIIPGTLTGNFQAGETLQVKYFDIAGNISSAIDIGVIATVGDTFSPLSARRNAEIAAIVADGNRVTLAPPPGSGSILGVSSLVSSGVRTVYAWRNTTDGTAAAIYKSSGTGWQAVTLYSEVRFTAGGTSAPAEGTTLTKGAVTATIKRVVQESGDWAANTAAGRFIITTPAGGNFSSGAATIGAINVTLSGIQTAITLLPSGRYTFDVSNFRGQLATRRIYGADGVNRGFEFDGDVLVPIETKAPVDTPKFVRAHHNHLVFGLGSSVMVSGPGAPYQFTAAAGGVELATGDEITGLLVQPGNQETAALAIFGRNSSGVLYGSSISTFNYKSLATMTGALPYMQANLDQSYVYDDRGVMSLVAAQEYGNFTQATLTANLDDFLTVRKGREIGCCVSTDRSQIRVFFNDGSALYLTIVNGRMIGAMPMQFYHPFTCVWSAEDASGNEETFAGGASGHVYQLDRGTSFDGAPISHYMIFTQNYMKAPSIKKVFRGGLLEMDSDYYTEFSVGYSLRYGSTDVFQAVQSSEDNALRAVPDWDHFIWDNFTWDGVTMGPVEVDIKGKSEVIQMVISGSSDLVPSFRLTALLTRFSYTRRTR